MKAEDFIKALMEGMVVEITKTYGKPFKVWRKDNAYYTDAMGPTKVRPDAAFEYIRKHFKKFKCIEIIQTNVIDIVSKNPKRIKTPVPGSNWNSITGTRW